jgi:basic amino acid/polyamine antiporter, APA family
MFMYQVSGLVPCFMLIWAYTDIGYFYPGANMMLASIIVAVLTVPTIGVTETLMTIAYPRSGGEYIWISRVFHPGLGFAAGVQYLMAQPSTVGMFSATLSSFVLASVFSTIGLMTNNPGLMAVGSTLGTPNMIFILGATITIIATLVMIAPLRVFSIYQYVGFIASIIGIAILFYLLGANTTGSFALGFDRYSSVPFEQLVATANQNGASVPTGFSMGATFLALPYLIWWATTYWNIYPAGEAKSPAKSMVVAGLGGMVLFWIIMIVGGILYYNVIPYQSAYSMTFLYYKGAAVLPAGMYPSPQLLAVFLTSNVWLVGILVIMFFVGFVYVWPGWWMVFSRAIFAYSFDRVLPTKLSEVNERTHTPIWAILLCTVLSFVFIFWCAYGPYFWAVTHFTLWACSTGFIPAMLAGAVFPYRKKEWFQASPKIVQTKILGIPLLTISGLLGAAVLIFQVAQTFIVDWALPEGRFGVGLEIGVWIAAFIIYYASKYYHLSKGIDITKAFKEIPPE